MLTITREPNFLLTSVVIEVSKLCQLMMSGSQYTLLHMNSWSLVSINSSSKQILSGFGFSTNIISSYGYSLCAFALFSSSRFTSLSCLLLLKCSVILNICENYLWKNNFSTRFFVCMFLKVMYTFYTLSTNSYAYFLTLSLSIYYYSVALRFISSIPSCLGYLILMMSTSLCSSADLVIAFFLAFASNLVFANLLSF